MKTQKNLMKNLDEFWSVQPTSGSHAHIFTSLEDALSQIQKWEQEMGDEFEKWERGQSSSVLIQSTIESNLYGGSFTSYRIHPACLPGGIYYHEVGSEESEIWEHNPGSEKVRWANLALARP